MSVETYLKLAAAASAGLAFLIFTFTSIAISNPVSILMKVIPTET